MSRYVRFVITHPVLTNAGIYGSMCAAAEFTQQTINRKIKSDNPEDHAHKIVTNSKTISIEKPIDYDKTIIGRYAVLGAMIFAPAMYKWYQILDKKFVGTGVRAVLTKMCLDQVVMAPPMIFSFYVGMSLMEGKEDVFEECKKKFVSTYKTSCIFWPPAQFINFFLISPHRRVAYEACCTYVWTNLLCLYKKNKIQIK